MLHDLPAVDIALEFSGVLVHRRRRPVDDPAGHAHLPRLAFGRHRKLRDRGTADRCRVHVGKVRDIEHVVVDELVMAAHVKRIGPSAGPFRMRGPPPVWDQRGIGFCRVAHPDPDPVPARNHRVGADARLRRDALLSGNFDAPPRGFELQAVVAAAQIIADHHAQRQLRVPVAATILQRHRRAIGLPVEHNRRVKKNTSEGLVPRYLAVPCPNVPTVTKEHGRSAVTPPD